MICKWRWKFWAPPNLKPRRSILQEFFGPGLNYHNSESGITWTCYQVLMVFADNRMSRSAFRDLCAYTITQLHIPTWTGEMGSELLRKYRRSVIKSFTFSHYSYFCGAFQSLRPNEKNFKKMISKHILLRIWWLAPNLEFPISNEATGQIFDVAIADNILISCQPNNQSCKNRFLDERCMKEYLKTQRMPLPFHPTSECHTRWSFRFTRFSIFWTLGGERGN